MRPSRCALLRVRAAALPPARTPLPGSGPAEHRRVLQQKEAIQRILSAFPSQAEERFQRYMELKAPNKMSLPKLKSDVEIILLDAGYTLPADAPLWQYLGVYPTAEPSEPRQLSVRADRSTSAPQRQPQRPSLPGTSAPSALPPMSKEQATIVQSALDGCNIRVSAVAGSGKTTTMLHLAKSLAMQREGFGTLALVYNAELKNDTRQRAKALGLSDVLEVHSFHAFALKFYGVRTDDGIDRVLREDSRPIKPLAFDCLVLDEAQDIRAMFYRLVCKLMRDNARGKEAAQMILLGDERQAIYQFLGADPRFLSASDRVFEGIAKPCAWRSHTLNTTFRHSGHIAGFWNENVLTQPLFVTQRPLEARVKYMVGNPFDIAEDVAAMIIERVKNGKFRPGDIFVLSPSVKQGSVGKKTPLNRLENALIVGGIPVFTPMSDDQPLPDGSKGVMDEKVVFSSFHQSKGRERRLVVVNSFDASYLKYHARSARKDICPNALYVAGTRARDLLIVCGEENRTDRLAFVKGIEASPHVELIDVSFGGSRRREPRDDEEIPISNRSVTQLVRHLPDHVVREALGCIPQLSTVVAPHYKAGYPGKIFDAQKRAMLVSDVVGLAVPAMYEHRTMEDGDFTLRREAVTLLALRKQPKLVEESGLATWVFSSTDSGESEKKEVEDLNENFESVMERPCAPTDITSHLFAAAVYDYCVSGMLGRVAAGVRVWEGHVTEAMLAFSFGTLREQFGEGTKVKYEQSLEAQLERFPDITVSGRADAVTSDILYELKTTNALEPEHILQLACYGWLDDMRRERELEWESEKPPGKRKAVNPRRRLRLVNLSNGEVRELRASPEALQAVVEVLVEHSLRSDVMLSDEVFFAQCRKDSNRWRRS